MPNVLKVLVQFKDPLKRTFLVEAMGSRRGIKGTLVGLCVGELFEQGLVKTGVGMTNRQGFQLWSFGDGSWSSHEGSLEVENHFR